jgi:hypothetical protein
MRRLNLLLILVASLLVGCEAVKPWQRGVLADRRMQWAPDPERAAAREHVLSVREGASGGQAGGGGACGCD